MLLAEVLLVFLKIEFPVGLLDDCEDVVDREGFVLWDALLEFLLELNDSGEDLAVFGKDLEVGRDVENHERIGLI